MLRNHRVWVVLLCSLCGEAAAPASDICKQCEFDLWLDDQRTYSQLSHELDVDAARAANGGY